MKQLFFTFVLFSTLGHPTNFQFSYPSLQNCVKRTKILS
jgi:hypothetical protein